MSRWKLPLVAAFAVAVLAIPACASEEDGTPVAAPSPTETVDGQQGEDGGGDVDFDAEIGDCVTLGGSILAAEIDHAECGSAEANYKVIAKAATRDECVSDADQTYYVTLGGVEQGALCLDTDWVVGGCMEVPMMDEPRRADCAAPESNTVRVLDILAGTTDETGCPDTATSYLTYDERQIVVCVEDL